jgi:hypothetical protein
MFQSRGTRLTLLIAKGGVLCDNDGPRQQEIRLPFRSLDLPETEQTILRFFISVPCIFPPPSYCLHITWDIFLLGFMYNLFLLPGLRAELDGV